MIPAALRDAEYRKQRDELLVEVQAKLQAMPQAERDKVAASLATLQRSIPEIEAALGHDPANALLQELLVSSCQEQMRALTAVRDSGAPGDLIMREFRIRPLIALCALGALPLAALAGGRSVDRKVNAEPNGEVVISNVSGTVDVRGWDRNEVQVTGASRR